MIKKSKNKWNLDYSFLEKKGYKDFASKLNLNSEKSAKAFKVFFNNLRKEASETKQASYLLVKYLKEGKLSKKEEILRCPKNNGCWNTFFHDPRGNSFGAIFNKII